MLTIRLSRVGRKKVKNFRITVSEKTKSPKRGSLDIIGYYNPETEPYTLSYDEAKLTDYVKKGAQVSPTLARLLDKAGVKGMKKFFDEKKKFECMTKDPEKLEAMKKAEEEAKAAEEAKNAPVEETPAEEAPAEEPAEAPVEEPKAE